MAGEGSEREWPLGKRYDGGVHAMRADDFVAYARATDDREAYGEVAPPMFHVRPFIGMMLGMAGDDELDIDMLRLVHGEHGVRFHRLLRDGDQLAVSGTLQGVAQKASGRIYTFGLRGEVDGELAVEGTTSYFVRAPTPPARKGPKKAEPELPEPTWSVAQPVRDDQALDYAAASGDDNPIHTDPEVAKKAGLPGCILHGLCTMAFAQRDLIAHYAPGAPERLQEIRVRFARPVFPGDTLTMSVWEGDDGLSFQTVDGRGKPVITGGQARFA
jgi:acyl dehydratase